MQTSRIHPQQWYQTKQGIGKCLSTAGKRLKFQIDNKEVWLTSSEVQHEIAKGEEPQESGKPRIFAKDERQPKDANAAYIAHLEEVNAELRDCIERAVENRIDDEWLKDARAVIAKAKGGS